jgi:hypothetical protein
MQSTEVISLFLNFAALQFVSEIDDIGYYMAKYGYECQRTQGVRLAPDGNDNAEYSYCLQQARMMSQ